MCCWGWRVGSDVSICNIVVGSCDRRRQHCCGAKDVMPWEWVAEADVLGRMCLYAPLLLGRMTDDISTIAKPKTQCHENRLLRLTYLVGYVYMHHCCWVAWQTMSALLQSQRRNAMIAEAIVLGRTCLNTPYCWGCMIDNVSTVAELEMQYDDNGLLRPTCWVERV